MLTEKRKADREKMAAMVAALCAELGATCEIRDMATFTYSSGTRGCRQGYREIACLIALGDGRATVRFSGDSNMPDHYCVPWNTRFDSRARMTSAFGRAVGAGVNPCHGRKCMGFADGINNLLERLRAALECIARGEAFTYDEESRP